MMATPPPLPPRLDWSFFLDVDGTLLEIAETPDRVEVEPAVLAVLDALRQASGGALALVSGRRIDDLDRLFQPLLLPSAGVHGLERRRFDGTVERAPGGDLSALRHALAEFAAQDSALRIEDKGLSLALHYRLAPQYEPKIRAFSEGLVASAKGSLRLLQGKMVVEFYHYPSNKGEAIAAFMRETPFAGRLPFFAGDDVTDEYGFRAVLGMDGVALRVGPPTSSLAPWSLPSVASFRSWLQSALPVGANPLSGRPSAVPHEPARARLASLPREGDGADRQEAAKR
ncbi:MAG: trehalose-phosphatase [Alphaproteobacteria bacterium]|nr:trehalose-phosphatase [Alphaproteobacteria bacterium]